MSIGGGVMTKPICVKFKRVRHDATVPTQSHPGDAWDLYASQFYTVGSHRPELIGTGIAVEMPSNVRAWVTPRSGMARKGITIPNAPGLVDPSYRGEIKVLLLSADWLDVSPGDRIAQLSFEVIPDVVLEEAEELTTTERGAGGFGSTGQ